MKVEHGIFESFNCVEFRTLRENPSEEDDYDNWASEASPTLGCSIEISRDILYLISRVRVEYG